MNEAWRLRIRMSLSQLVVITPEELERAIGAAFAADMQY